VDVSGVTLVGAQTDSAKNIQALVRENFGSGCCSVIGTEHQVTAPGAALANGTAAHALDFDDNAYAGIVHGSAVVFPAVLAVAQHRGVTGQDLLRGFIAGLEVEFALGQALTHAIYEKGWWTTAVLGAIGAAAGASCAAGYDADTTSRALALAAVGTGGLRAARGSSAKPYHCGRAAESGVMAAMFAENGATAPMDAFEDRNGFLHVFNDSVFDRKFIENIGYDFGMESPGIDIKRYPVCYASHAAADAVADIMSANGLVADEIKSVVCFVPPIVALNLTFPRPSTGTEAQFSLEFAVAAIILYRSITLDHLNSDIVTSPEMRHEIDKISMCVCDLEAVQKESANVSPEWASVTLTTVEGTAFETFVGSPTGSAANPMSDEALNAKFMTCANQAGVIDDASDLLVRLRAIEHVNDSRTLFGSM
jgi:2-methylcitrate dehydratase PrpD